MKREKKKITEKFSVSISQKKIEIKKKFKVISLLLFTTSLCSFFKREFHSRVLLIQCSLFLGIFVFIFSFESTYEWFFEQERERAGGRKVENFRQTWRKITNKKRIKELLTTKCIQFMEIY